MKTIEQKAGKKTRNPFKAIPWYGWVGAIIFIVFQIGLYKLACFFAQNIANHWKVNPKINAIDNAIPYCPYFFIEIYFLAYGFWFIAPLWISTSKNKENFINFMIFSTIASFIGFFWMFLMPTWMNRTDHEIWGVAGENLINKAAAIKTPISRFLMQSIIEMDTGDIGWNLCPSYHCMASAICAFGVLRRKEHHIGTQIGFGVMAILVCMATVFVKQHYFVDILGGVGVAAIPYVFICYIWHPGEKIILNNPLFLTARHLNKKDVSQAKEAKDTTKSEYKKKLDEIK